MFSQQAKVCTVVPGDLFHILNKGRRNIKFIYFNRSLSAVVEYFDRSLGYIPSVQIYCHEANLPALLSNYQQATVPQLSNYIYIGKALCGCAKRSHCCSYWS